MSVRTSRRLRAWVEQITGLDYDTAAAAAAGEIPTDDATTEALRDGWLTAEQAEHDAQQVPSGDPFDGLADTTDDTDSGVRR